MAICAARNLPLIRRRGFRKSRAHIESNSRARAQHEKNAFYRTLFLRIEVPGGACIRYLFA